MPGPIRSSAPRSRTALAGTAKCGRRLPAQGFVAPVCPPTDRDGSLRGSHVAGRTLLDALVSGVTTPPDPSRRGRWSGPQFAQCHTPDPDTGSSPGDLVISLLRPVGVISIAEALRHYCYSESSGTANRYLAEALGTTTPRYRLSVAQHRHVASPRLRQAPRPTTCCHTAFNNSAGHSSSCQGTCGQAAKQHQYGSCRSVGTRAHQ